MRISNYNNEIYKMYEKEVSKVEKLNKLVKEQKLSIDNLNYELKKRDKNTENKIKTAVDKVTKPLMEENSKLKEELKKAIKEIDRLKTEITLKNKSKDKDYLIDKLNNQINKDSTNSSIPTSKEIRKPKTGANIYNHREKTNRKTGGQVNHKGRTLTKKEIEEKIKRNKLKVIEIEHYVKSNQRKANKIKYKVGISMEMIIEKHIFIYGKKYQEKMPIEYYSDVTYSDSIKSLIVMLGNYYSLSYSKIQELLSDLTNGIVNISQGTIDNIYKDFSIKTEETLNNITTNILNGKYTHTDETVTNENGKESYYRGYGNKDNILYKYHHKKGDKPIKEDDILPNYYGTIISDHEAGIFKYGTNNQDCVIHIGRYCNEQIQNIYEINWPEDMFKFLLRIEQNRKILLKLGKNKFTKEEIRIIEEEYDDILNRGIRENKEIVSTYWKEKSNTLLKRLKKYKNCVLFYIYDFSIPYDNNFMERALRMIKSKTKVSGGFRSEDGAIRFGNTMSIIKTARLRKMNIFNCINMILKGETLFS